MMNGTETVQGRVTEPGGMLAATTLTWMADIVIELAPPMLMAWVGEPGRDKKKRPEEDWNEIETDRFLPLMMLYIKTARQISASHDALH